MSDAAIKIALQMVDQATSPFARSMSSIEKTATTAGNAIKLALGALVASAPAAAIKDATLLAARYETLGVVMGVIGNNAGYTSAEMNNFAKGLRDSGIAAVESREVLARLAQANIDLTQSSKLARIAQDAAVVGNINSSEAFERLVYGIQSAQVEMLRTIGINVNFENEYQKVAKQLGKTSNELTEQEKVNARVNVVMQAGAQISGTYEAAMDTVGKKMNSTKRYSDDLKVSIGEIFTPALNLLVDQYSTALKDASSYLLENKDIAEQWSKGLMLGILRVEQEFVRFSMYLDKIGGSMTTLGAVVTFGDTDKQFREWNSMYAKRYAENAEVYAGLVKMEEGLQNEGKAAGETAKKLAELEKQRIAAGKAARENLIATNASTKEIKELKPTKFKTKVVLDENDYARQIEKTQQMIDELSLASLPEHAQAVEQIKRKYAEWQQQIESLVGAGSITFDQAQEWVDGLSANMQIDLDSLGEKTEVKTDEISTYWDEAMRSMQHASEQFFFDAITGDFDDLASSFEDMLARMAASYASSIFNEAMFGTNNADGSTSNGLVQLGTAWIASMFHDGGTVGSDGRSIIATQALWHGAKRYHTGLNADEFPAILQKGERVIPKDQANNNQVYVNVANYGQERATTQETRNPDGSRTIDVLIGQVEGRMAKNVVQGNSPLWSAFRQTSGISRAPGAY